MQLCPHFASWMSFLDLVNCSAPGCLFRIKTVYITYFAFCEKLVFSVLVSTDISCMWMALTGNSKTRKVKKLANSQTRSSQFTSPIHKPVFCFSFLTVGLDLHCRSLVSSIQVTSRNEAKYHIVQIFFSHTLKPESPEETDPRC